MDTWHFYYYTLAEENADAKSLPELSFVELGQLARLGFTGDEAEEIVDVGTDEGSGNMPHVVLMEQMFGRIVRNISERVCSI